MGAGIAYVTAKAGIDVVLKDVTHEAALKEKAYAEGREAGTLSRGLNTEERSTALLNRITPTADAADFEGVDVVVEAVFENTELKHQVFAEIEGRSRRSAGPIPSSRSPDCHGRDMAGELVGIHFFSPVIKWTPSRSSEASRPRTRPWRRPSTVLAIEVSDRRQRRSGLLHHAPATFLTEAIKMLHEDRPGGDRAGRPSGRVSRRAPAAGRRAQLWDDAQDHGRDASGRRSRRHSSLRSGRRAPYDAPCTERPGTPWHQPQAQDR